MLMIERDSVKHTLFQSILGLKIQIIALHLASKAIITPY